MASFPKCHRRLPTVLSGRGARLIDSTGNLMCGAMMMMLYATGECRPSGALKLADADIDSECMMLHVPQGKGGRDRRSS